MGWGFLFLCKFLSKSWLGCVLFDMFVLVLAPCGNICLYWKILFSCSCIVHSWKLLLHTRCLTECPSDILVLNWTQLSSNDWVYSWLIFLTLFWSVCVYFTHFVHFVPQCHAMHTLGPFWHTSCISWCTHIH